MLFVGSSVLGTPRSRGAPKKRPRGPAVVARPQGTIRFVRIRGIRVHEFWDIQAAKNSKDSWHSRPKNVMSTCKHEPPSA